MFNREKRNISRIAVNGELEPGRSHICQRWEPGQRRGKNTYVTRVGDPLTASSTVDWRVSTGAFSNPLSFLFWKSFLLMSKLESHIMMVLFEVYYLDSIWTLLLSSRRVILPQKWISTLLSKAEWAHWLTDRVISETPDLLQSIHGAMAKAAVQAMCGDSPRDWVRDWKSTAIMA